MSKWALPARLITIYVMRFLCRQLSLLLRAALASWRDENLMWFIALQVNEGTPSTGARPNYGGELYREYRHDAVSLRYASIMLLLVRLIAAILPAHLSHVTAVAMTIDAEVICHRFVLLYTAIKPSVCRLLWQALYSTVSIVLVELMVFTLYCDAVLLLNLIWFDLH